MRVSRLADQLPVQQCLQKAWGFWERMYQSTPLPQKHLAQKLNKGLGKSTASAQDPKIGSPFMEKSRYYEGGSHFPRLSFVEREEQGLEGGQPPDADVAPPSFTNMQLDRANIVRSVLSPTTKMQSFEESKRQTLHERGQYLSQSAKQWSRSRQVTFRLKFKSRPI
jgi:hypothetical protein